VWILSGHGFVFLNCFSKMNWLIFNVNKCFTPNSYLVTVTFLNFGVDWEKTSLYVVEARSWSYYTFQDTYLCEAGFSSKNIKRNSDLDWFPKMTREYYFQPLFSGYQILCVENKHESVTEWLTGLNCLPFFNRREIQHGWLYIPSS